MEPHQQPQPTSSNDKNEGGHRGPLSRTWPQLFKKRRRYSPVRESAQQAQAPPAPSVITADSASSISSIAASISQTSLSTPPPPKIPISRRSSSANGSVIGTPTSSGNGRLFSVSEATSPITATPQADLLASKSNYELIASGQHLEMGLHFSTAMASGVMMKRATHRAAEQARRDRMKTAMVDLAEFLLDGEVTFGSGTTCFVVMRGGADGKDDMLEDDKFSKSKKSSEAGEKKTVNKARLIEMALEKLKAQEKEIEMLRKDLENCSCRMDTTE